MAKHAVIVVDLENEYLPTGNLPLVGIEEAVANAVRVIDSARRAGDLVINIRHESSDPDSPLFNASTPGVQFMDAVLPQGDEPVIVKHFPNSFLKTDLSSILDQHGITDVTIVGAMSHMCIDATTRAASDLGYKVTVVHDACATLDLEFKGHTIPAAHVHNTLMAALAFAYAEVVSTQEYLAA